MDLRLPARLVTCNKLTLKPTNNEHSRSTCKTFLIPVGAEIKPRMGDVSKITLMQALYCAVTYRFAN